MITVLVACDKFKGSLESSEVNAILQQEIIANVSDCRVIQFPMADGGEGLTEILIEKFKGKRKFSVVRDPLFRPIQASYGISADGETAFIEMASASGLQRVEQHERNPSLTTTFGTGELIKDALEQGIRKFIIGIGGSATNDGGLGIAKALGIKVYDRDERLLDPVGKSLLHVYYIDDAEIHPMLKDAHFTVLTDVNALAYGPQGAAQMFSRQKGANEEMVVTLEKGMRHYVSRLGEIKQVDLNFSGAGAGGGVPIFFKAFTSCNLMRGADFLLKSSDFQGLIKSVDWVNTGEGKLDRQTLQGKVVYAVANEAKKYGKKLLIMVGQNVLSPIEYSVLNADKIISLQTSDLTEEACMLQAASLLRQSAKNAIIPFLQSARVD